MRFFHDLGNLTAIGGWSWLGWIGWRVWREERREDEQSRRDREFARQHRVVRP